MLPDILDCSSMNIAIDVREALKPKITGKGAWVRGCVTELIKRDHEFTLLSAGEVPEAWKKPNVTIVVLPHGAIWHFKAASFLKKHKPDLYLSPTSFIVPSLLGKKVPYTPVIHDLIAFRREPHDWKATLIEQMLMKRTLANAKHIYCISKATKKDLLTKFPHVRSNSVSIVYAGPIQNNVKLNIPDGKTILCVGTLCPRKNQLRLIHAYNKIPINLRKKYSLILVGGRGWHDKEIVELAEQSDGVDWKKHIPDIDYLHLLSTCTVLAFPSLYEGFGLQVLDALQRGIPVLTSNRGSLSEIAGTAAILKDPEDENSIAEGLTTLLTDKNLQNKLRSMGPLQANKFSWAKTVDLILEVIG